MNRRMQHRSLSPAMRGRAAGAALVLAILLAMAAVAPPAAQAQTFATFDAPGAGTGADQGTIALSINTAGVVVGFTSNASAVSQGFVRAANGTITAINVSGAGTGKNQGTTATGVNTAGVIAGTFADSNTAYHGFVRVASGTITVFNVAGAGTGKHQGTYPMSINTSGVIAGIYKDSSSQYHGFSRAANGTISTFDAPGAGTGYSVGTIPLGINTAGAIVGLYKDSSGGNHGFVRSANGATITTIDDPDAGTAAGHGTIALSINSAGVITGGYTDASSVAHGFVRAVNGTLTSFDVPGAGADGFLALLAPMMGGGPPSQGTGGVSINTAGEIAGAYADSGAMYHGFSRTAQGAITTFNVPGAGTAMLQGTAGFSINTAGTIAGTYGDTKSVFHGFVLTSPAATTTTLISSLNPSTYEQAVTFTAGVSSKSGVPPDGEIVTFMKGTTVLGTGKLSGGSAVFETSSLKAGTNAIKAVYAGDANFATSTSKAVSQVVDKATTTTTLASSLNPSNAGQSVTFTATVKPQFSGTPTGNVTFKDGTAALKTVAVTGGVAKYTTTTLAAGKHSITATYNGSTSFDSSSGSLTQTVN